MSVQRPSDDPADVDLVEAAHPGFRSWQRMWRHRAAAARRMPAYDDAGNVDPLLAGHQSWRNRHDWAWCRDPRRPGSNDGLHTTWQWERVCAAQTDGRWPA